MARSKANTAIEPTCPSQPGRKTLYRGIWPIIVVGLVFAGLIWLGFWLRQQVRPLDAYSLDWDRIDCLDPPGRKHLEFLGEVRYLGELPSKLPIDEKTIQRVAGAFGNHPWVQKVQKVDLGLHRPRVQLVFRTPVLAIVQAENGMGRVRSLDPSAIVLPADAPVEGLPRYQVRDDMAMRPAGQRYVDPDIKTAAATAGYLHDLLGAWQIVSVHIDASGLSLTSNDGTRIEWGRAPGAELATEAPAASKREWLRAYFESRGAAFDKRSIEIVDVRGPGEMTIGRVPVVGAKP